MECELKDIAIHYEVFGEGIPIVMLHGWSTSGLYMLTTMEPLFRQRQGWKRIYPDLPGHGRTPARDWITSQDKILDVALDFIEAVIPGQRFVVAGTSAGALLARGVVFRKAAMLDGLLLTVPMIVAADAERKVPARVWIVKDPGLSVQLLPEDAAAFKDQAVVQTQKVVDGLKVPVVPAGATGDQAFQAAIRADPDKYGLSFDVDALTEPFPAPTLIIAGRQDWVVGYRQAWEILEHYPRGTYAVLDRAGHLLVIEQEKLFGALVWDWLDRVEEYAATAK